MTKFYECPFKCDPGVEWDARCSCTGTDDWISCLVDGGFEPENATAAFIVLARHWAEFETLTKQQEIVALEHLETFEGREPDPDPSIKFGAALGEEEEGQENKK